MEDTIVAANDDFQWQLKAAPFEIHTQIFSADGVKTFYTEEQYHAYQREEAEQLWNQWGFLERLKWWFQCKIMGYSETPVYGAKSQLIGRPGFIPGTRISYFE